MRFNSRGFTILELLVVMAIIFLLSAIVLTSLYQSRTAAKVSRAKEELRQLANAIDYAKSQKGQTLDQITGTYQSDISCIGAGDLRNGPNSTGNALTCYNQWVSDLNAIQAAEDVYPGIAKFARDPWGSPYVLDEAANQSGYCRAPADTLASAGPNGVYDSTSGGQAGDDLWITVAENAPQPQNCTP